MVLVGLTYCVDSCPYCYVVLCTRHVLGLGTLPPVQAAAECDYHSIMEESMDTKPTSCFVLDDKNLANYRTWLKTVREKARSERGRLTELHLIGEEVPAGDTSNEDPTVAY